MTEEEFSKKVEAALKMAHKDIMYFHGINDDAETMGLRLASWIAELSAKNKYIHLSNYRKEKVDRHRKHLYYIDFGVNVGSEFSFPHFCVVIKEFSQTAIVIPLSSEKEDDPEWKTANEFCVPIGCLDSLPLREKKSHYALVNQIKTVSKQRLSVFKDPDNGGRSYPRAKLSANQMDLIDTAVSKFVNKKE